MTESKTNDVITKYAVLDQSVKVKPDCLIGVGYNMCSDINFRAAELFKVLEPRIADLEKNTPIKPQVHKSITNLR